jgi:ribonuclease HI
VIISAYTDGASRGNPGESGYGFLLKDEKGTLLHSASGYLGQATNNIAEYEALLACLKQVMTMSCERLIVHSDSELMVRQLNGIYRVKDVKLRKYYQTVTDLLRSAPFRFEIRHVERALNSEADKLANEGIDSRTAVSA